MGSTVNAFETSQTVAPPFQMFLFKYELAKINGAIEPISFVRVKELESWSCSVDENPTDQLFTAQFAQTPMLAASNE